MGVAVDGYEIHQGRTRRRPAGEPWLALDDDGGVEAEGCRSGDNRVFGTSVHGLFESDAFRGQFLALVAAGRGKRRAGSGPDYTTVRTAQFDRLADALETHLDLDALRGIVASAR